MKKQLMPPLAAVACGAAAFVLRLIQMHTGFEPSTGLPIPGARAGLALAVLLAAAAVVLFLLVRRLPAESGDGPAFPADFASGDPRFLALPVAGVFLIAISGVLDLLSATGLLDNVLSAAVSAADPSGMTAVMVVSTGGFSPLSRLLLGILSLISAVGLFPTAVACRRGRERECGLFLLLPVVALVIRLVLTYRVDSVNPALSAYYVELLTLVFLTLGFYRLSSFAFRAGRTRRFALYACAAVVLTMAVLADGGSGPSSILVYLGGTSALLGFLLLRLTAAPAVSGDNG